MAPVAHYPDVLLENLRSVAPLGVDDPTVILLTPGCATTRRTSVHASLAQRMGIELSQGRTLLVRDNQCLCGPRAVRSGCRRDLPFESTGHDFLDPRAFRADSTLGVTGLLLCTGRGR